MSFYYNLKTHDFISVIRPIRDKSFVIRLFAASSEVIPHFALGTPHCR